MTPLYAVDGRCDARSRRSTLTFPAFVDELQSRGLPEQAVELAREATTTGNQEREDLVRLRIPK
jgi:hypothetical protein